jgi:predicted O-methyltransferase YrrM
VPKPANAATYRAATVQVARGVDPRRVVVEVGVYAGGLSKLLSALPGIDRYIIVDNWHGSYTHFGQEHMDKVAAEVIAWARTQPHVEVMRMTSAEAAIRLAAEGLVIDFFHTDGNHEYQFIKQDIELWMPMVRPGGIVSGDNFEIPAVARAARELVPGLKLGANGRLWYARKW